MTDNEKAATFIGWQPGEEVFNALGIFDIPAPDMSDPRNYMRALVAISNLDDGSREPKISWGDWDAPKNWTTKPWPSWRCQVVANPDAEKLNIIRGYGLTPEESVITALAALYDAEHKDEQ